MSSSLDSQWIKGRYSSSQCSSSSSHLAEPVLPGSACSSRGLPCCWLCISFNPNPFHTSGKIPMKCQCFWSFWAGLQAPDPARLWERQMGLGPGLELSCCCCVQPTFLGWKMGLLFACCGQSPWAVFPDSQPASVLSSLSHLCFEHVPSTVEAVEEGALTQPMLCPVSLQCS